jgi:hypothetical protein
MYSCMMKDVALAYLITHGGGKLQDYGFETPQGVIINPNQLGVGQYAFPSDEKRAAAFVKYGWKQLKDGIAGPTPKETPKDGPKSGPMTTPVPAPTPPPPK